MNVFLLSKGCASMRCASVNAKCGTLHLYLKTREVYTVQLFMKIERGAFMALLAFNSLLMLKLGFLSHFKIPIAIHVKELNATVPVPERTPFFTDCDWI